MKSADFLDAVRARHAIPSDRQLARFLGMTESRISLYRCGRREFGEETALQIAAALELDPGYVFAELAAERAKCTAVRDAWRRLSELARTAPPAIFAVCLVGIIAATAAQEAAHATTGYYVKWRRYLSRACRWRLLAGSGGESKPCQHPRGVPVPSGYVACPDCGRVLKPGPHWRPQPRPRPSRRGVFVSRKRTAPGGSPAKCHASGGAA